MKSQIPIKEYISSAIQESSFAVLATEGDGQPHASFIAITPLGGIRQLIFATYKSTRKYRNLANNNGKVALLIFIGDPGSSDLRESIILTGFGQAEEIDIIESKNILLAHLKRHPDLELFLQSQECALFRVEVTAYQLVRGIDDVEWWSVSDPDSD